MDVYVATKAENYRVARIFMRAIEEAGHDITHDWTKQVEAYGAGPDDPEFRRQCAQEDLKGVVDCDAFIIVMRKGMVGSLIEFGVAIANNKAIYMVVDSEHWPMESIFFDLPEITYMYPSLAAIGNAVDWVDRLQALAEAQPLERSGGVFPAPPQ